ncbi:metalloregulator ArsR/SmtB family transcription factor [Nocardia amamiensis]|uniref:metalloregulator ArsR/SmtB family transcription factor n=1 Tax=Nocardia amamiensis TaxID=404578 RepID=UPI000837457E|nr:metalloregulator ArsR/SmtB family transcription factor [Nocardia amamiensis]
MDEVAAAIADPVRREIMELLLGARRTAGEIAGHFTISRPAVSRHLRVLRESGLVRDELVGRERFYMLDTGPLAALTEWLARFEQQQTAWAHHLDALETEVYRTRRERRSGDQDATRENTA